MKFFSGQGKVREFYGWPGKFRKDLEKSGNMKINGYGRQSSENLFILSKRGNGVLSQPLLPPHWGLLLKRKNLLNCFI